MRKLLAIPAIVCAVWATTEVVPLGHEAIRYTQTAPADDISELSNRLASGKVRFQSDAALGYLPSLLKALDIPFDGDTYDARFLLADVKIDWDVRTDMVSSCSKRVRNTGCPFA